MGAAFISVSNEGVDMGAKCDQWKGAGQLVQILNILEQPSHKKEVCEFLPNGGAGYDLLEKEGCDSMKADAALLLRAHYANGGNFGLPKGRGAWTGIKQQ